MKITHHPGHESLMSCSAGSMPEAFAAVMASHIEVCQTCRADLAIMEDIGVSLFGNISPQAMSREAPVMEFRRSESDVDSLPPVSIVKGDVPLPLQQRIGAYLDDIPWKTMAPGVKHHQIELSQGALGDLRLIKVAPGHALPEHGHGGSELTLVLRGSYKDQTGEYKAGDLADLDDSIEHSPVAHPVDGCICLIATDRKIRFKSVFAKLLQPLTGM